MQREIFLKTTGILINKETGEEKRIELNPSMLFHKKQGFARIEDYLNQTDPVGNIITTEQKKKLGRHIGSKNKKQKYKLEWKGKEYLCKNYKEIGDIVGKSKYAIGRLMRNENTFKCKERCKDLLEIKITNL